MASKVNVGWLLLSVVLGAAIGIGVAMTAYQFGLSSKVIGPMAGGLTGALVPLIYRWRTEKLAGASEGSR